MYAIQRKLDVHLGQGMSHPRQVAKGILRLWGRPNEVVDGKQAWQLIDAYWKATPGIQTYLRQPTAKRPTSARGGFYVSREWRRLRYKVLAKRGACCECCGSTAADGAVMHVDHIKPRSRSPELELVAENLQILCEACNVGKGARDCTDWRPEHRRFSSPAI